MTRAALTEEVLASSPRQVPKGVRVGAIAAAVIGAAGLAAGFVAGRDPGAGWTAVLVATVTAVGLAFFGALLSAIFELSGARWGRSYRRLAEASVALMPLGVVGVAVLLIGGSAYLPWVHEHPHVGGKAIWLTRGFWDARVAGLVAALFGLGGWFVYLSLRRDFCTKSVKERFDGRLARFLGRGIEDPPAEAARCGRRMAVLAPIVAISYGVFFSVLAIDLIMALEPDWYSTLFGGWVFVTNIFAGLALMGVVTVWLRSRLKLERFLGEKRQSDLATLLFAFSLLTADFFWNQYLPIWYANLPEETFYVIERTRDTALPWRGLSFAALAMFFFIPFFALLMRKVKQSRVLLPIVALICFVGVVLCRFIEIAPALVELNVGAGFGDVVLPLLSTAAAVIGVLGTGLHFYYRFLTDVPLMPVGDEIFAGEYARGESKEAS